MEGSDLKTVDSTAKPRRGLRPSRELQQAIYDLWRLAREEALRDVPQNSKIAKSHAASNRRKHSMSSQTGQSY